VDTETVLRRGEMFVEVGVNSGRIGMLWDRVILISDYLTASGGLSWHGYHPMKRGDKVLLNTWGSKTGEIQVRFTFLWGFPFEE